MPQINTRNRAKQLRIAIAGNPNAGKTTIFNHLTGFRQRVGNYPGVTVEKKEGEINFGGYRMLLVDLPGIYSLTPYSLEELVTRNVILDEKPDVVIDVIDSTNLERNLYLATQLEELGVPLVLALNMSDEALVRGIEFNTKKLSSLLGVKIVRTVGHKREGIDDLLAAVLEVAQGPKLNGNKLVRIKYGRDIEKELDSLEQMISSQGTLEGRYNSRWLAVKLLEEDKDIVGKIGQGPVTDQASAASGRLTKLLGDKTSTIIAERRYGFISGACQMTVRITAEARQTMSDKVDEWVMNEALGIPILLAMMYAVFQFTFTLGDPVMRVIEWSFEHLGIYLNGFWAAGSESMLRSLIVDGIIGGVGGVIVFLPNIIFLFLAIALLEDTGYMARGAFVMDRLMHKIGLHGKSFIPLLIGFGCSIPAIMATRTLENKRDRLLTMLITPLMSCGARLTIYALIIPAFFPAAWQAPVLWIIYVIGILLAIGLAKLLNKTMLKGLSDPFVMELPPYRIPTLKSLLIHTWERARLYLKKAGTLILGVSILLWALAAFPQTKVFSAEIEAETAQIEQTYGAGLQELGARLGLSGAGVESLEQRLRSTGPAQSFQASPSAEEALIGEFVRLSLQAQEGGQQRNSALKDQSGQGGLRADADYYIESIQEPYNQGQGRIRRLKYNEQLSNSFVGWIGKKLAVVLSPLGFDWKISTALIGAFAAKEVYVAQMGIIYAVEDAEATGAQSLRERLQKNYSPLIAICMLLFCLIGTPCMATLAVTRKESGSWGYAILQWVGLTVMAYVITLLVFQLGSFFSLGV